MSFSMSDEGLDANADLIQLNSNLSRLNYNLQTAYAHTWGPVKVRWAVKTPQNYLFMGPHRFSASQPTWKPRNCEFARFLFTSTFWRSNFEMASGDAEFPLLNDNKDVVAYPPLPLGAGGSSNKWAGTLSNLITSTGNFNVQYNFSAISIALIVMSQVECTENDDIQCQQGHQKSWVSGTSGAAVFAGAIFGQVTMGYAGDIIGRNAALTLTLSIAAIGALLSAIAPSGSAQSVYIIIIICRFLMGVGLGGTYPCAATKAAEDGAAAAARTAFINTNTSSNAVNEEFAIDNNIKNQDICERVHRRGCGAGNENKHGISNSYSGDAAGSASAWAYFWQAPGAMTPWVLALLFTYVPTSQLDVNMRWRLLLGLGTIPAMLAVLLSYVEAKLGDQEKEKENKNLRLLQQQQRRPEHSGGLVNKDLETTTPSISLPLQVSAIGTIQQPHQQRNILMEKGGLYAALMDSVNQRMLLVTGGAWFLYDICYYGVALFGGQILEAINHPDDDNVTTDTNVRATTIKELIALSMAIPSTILSIYLLKKWTTKNLQIYGFILISVCFIALAVLSTPLQDSPHALFLLYCILLFALTFGPNVTTYILPAEVYPKEIRSTFNGISAACGKLGAMTGAYVFGPLADATSYNFVFFCCSVIALIGAALSFVFLPNQVIAATATVGAESKIKEDNEPETAMSPLTTSA